MMGKLIYLIANGIARSLEYPKPKVKLFTVPSAQVLEETKLMGLELLYPTLLDHYQDYYYLVSSEWAEVLDYIYFKFDMPHYLIARMDCEDFALLMKSLVSTFFGVNCFAVVFGESPTGYHSWNIFRTHNGWLQLEPQNGTLSEIGKNGYKAEWILI